jgi:hypothetical protein
MVAWSAAKTISGNGACFMPQEHLGAESDCTPQMVLLRFFCSERCIGHLAPQQQHFGAAKKEEASMTDGVVSKVARSTSA